MQAMQGNSAMAPKKKLKGAMKTKGGIEDRMAKLGREMDARMAKKDMMMKKAKMKMDKMARMKMGDMGGM